MANSRKQKAERQIFRQGRGKITALVGAVVAWLSAVFIFLLLTTPEIAPNALYSLVIDQQLKPTFISRLLGLVLIAVTSAWGVFLWQVAPFLGGHRIMVDNSGIECTDGQTWVRAAWHEVDAFLISEDIKGTLLYSIKTHQGEFNFTSQHIDKAEDLAALVKTRLDSRSAS